MAHLTQVEDEELAREHRNGDHHDTMVVECPVCAQEMQALGFTVEAEKPRHTVRGQTSDNGWPYGTTHDMDCPACVASGSSFTTSPRSETYWSS